MPQPVSRSRESRGRSPIGTAVLAAVVGLGVVFLVPVATSASATATTGPTIAAVVFSQMNSERAANHVPALVSNIDLIHSAHAHNLAMAKANSMSHQLPGEAVFTTRISNAGYRWSNAAENIAWSTTETQAGAQALQTAMYNEKAPENSHRVNMLNKVYKNVGVDVYLDAVHHKLWLTEDFASPR